MNRFDLLDATDVFLRPSDDPAIAIDLLRTADIDRGSHEARDRILESVGRHPDIADRRCRPGHLTGSALVVDATATATLLLLHTKLGRWFQPGGHADGDLNLAAVALREATEETGIENLSIAVPAIDLDIHEVRPPAEDPHLHLDLRFLVVAPVDAVETGNEESLALRWVRAEDLDELDPEVDESTRRLVRRGLRIARRLL